MARKDSILGYLKGKKVEVTGKESEIMSGVVKTYSFTSIGGGTGSTMLIVYLAQYIAKELGKQVCVLDLNFTEPDILYHFDVDVTTENTLLNYLKGKKPLEECYIQDKNLKTLHLVTTSPKDDPLMLLSIGDDEERISNLVERLEIYDYVLVNLPYSMDAVGFIGAVQEIDRGYVVLDERLSSIVKLKQFLDYLHVFHGKSNNFNNVILNKRSDYEYTYDRIVDAKCDIVSEIPYEADIVRYMNRKGILFEQPLSRRFQSGLIELLSDMNV